MSLAPEQAEKLSAAAGEGGFESHAPREIDGVAVAATLRPADGEALGHTLGALSEAGLAALVVGGGSRLGLGNPPRRADVLLSTRRLAGVDGFEPGEGVCHAGAGTPLAAVRSVVEEAGWELPLDPPGEASTVGGAIAAAACGPRALGYGPVRDTVLGLEVALPTGERTRCGGRVVKNVTGYDLAKLYTGSLGSLGVVEGAWLRLRPAPECARVLVATLPTETACATGLAAARLVTARAAVLVAAREARLVVELAGDAAAVDRDAQELGSAAGASEADLSALAEARQAQAQLPSAGGGMRFRLTVLPSRLGDVFAALRAAGGELVVHPGRNVLHVGFELDEGDDARVGAVFASIADAATLGGGGYVLEEAPVRVKRGHDVFGPQEDVLPIARALKQRFDPRGTLNPGRFQGFL
ncbi:MAG: FAD-binding oxidoreductase [Myxococcota bacterium]|nr:FAD-binding oxidoreductase [Myxococcota bacterium]